MTRICSNCGIEFECKEDTKHCSGMCSCYCPKCLFKDRGGDVSKDLDGKLISMIVKDCFREEQVMFNLVSQDL